MQFAPNTISVAVTAEVYFKVHVLLLKLNKYNCTELFVLNTKIFEFAANVLFYTIYLLIFPNFEINIDKIGILFVIFLIYIASPAAE